MAQYFNPTSLGAARAKSLDVGQSLVQDELAQSAKVLRRSSRVIRCTSTTPSSCGQCGLLITPWNPTAKFYVPICPECNHFNNEEDRQYTETCNRQLLCATCKHQHQISPRHRICACPCECSAHDGDQDDADYTDSSEPEDDVHNSLKDRATAAEQPMARKYGWRTNVISNLGHESERSMFFEAPGHHAVGCMHDIGNPQESSLANSENTVGRTEVCQLHKNLEPWELEAVHLSTGRSYSCLFESFPEACYMQLPTNWHPDQDRWTIPNCRDCRKPYSDEFLEWAQEGNAIICELCGITKRPNDIEDDPDYRVFNVDFHRAMGSCYCRCTCLSNILQLTTNSDPAFEEDSSALDSAAVSPPF